MSLQAKRELLFRVRSRYLEADKHQKGVILDGFITASGYRRKYAISLLNGEAPKPVPQTRVRRPHYDEDFRLALLTIWNTTNQICGKRLVPFLPDLVQSLEKFGHLSISAETRKRLLSVSAATVDRIVSKERAKYPKGKSLTKPGGLLKRTIKVRTFSDWNEAQPGFFEADLVAHCGDQAEGAFINTLVLTDISSGWIEIAPLLRRCHSDVIVALDAIRQVMPIPLLGLDTDNGSEFINYDLLSYCEKEMITFTRSRPYRKNDQAHVEQKNGNVVRRIVGYDQFEGLETWRAMLKLYRTLRLYVNFFQPSMKLISKQRHSSKVTKTYDRASTPFQRLMNSPKIIASTKSRLSEIYANLDPVVLFQQISQQQDALARAAAEFESLDVGKECNWTDSLDFTVELRKSLTWDRKKHKPHNAHKPRKHRTRKDPFEAVRDEIKLAVQLNPALQAKELFSELQRRHPENFKGNEGRTLQRRVAEIRESLAERDQIDLRPDTILGAAMVRI